MDEIFGSSENPDIQKDFTIIGTYIHKISNESGFVLNHTLPLKPSIKEPTGRKGKASRT